MNSKLQRQALLIMKTILARLLYTAYSIKRNWLRSRILRLIDKLEEGEMVSVTRRRIFMDYHKINIGLYSYGGCFNAQNIAPNTKIGRYCSFAGNVYIFNGNHPISFKSLHPYFYNPIFGYVTVELMKEIL